MELIRVSQLSAMSESEPLCVNHHGVPYCVLLVDGRPKAYVTLCSHKDKVFEPQVKGRSIVCPFHQVHFDAATGDVQDRNGQRVPEGLLPVAVEVRDGWVYLKTSEEHRGLLARAEGRRRRRRAEKERRRRWLKLLGIR